MNMVWGYPPRPCFRETKIMYLPALTLGYAVPVGNFDAAIHSVFHSALNLRPRDEDRLLTLVVSSEPDLPQGIRLDTPDGFSFKNFLIGESTTCRDGILYFEKGLLTVPLNGARRWDSDLSKLEVDTSKPSVSSALNFVWDMLNQRQRRLNADIIADELFSPGESAMAKPIPSKAGKALRELINAAQNFDQTGISAAETVIGLGSGLTPSGDDLLVGFMAGLWCTVQNKSKRTLFISELGKTITALSSRTNDISRTYLYHAAYGHASSRLIALIESINNGKITERLLEMAESAMQTGSTSGMDVVTGLLVGISAWGQSNE
jgi:hypothetical protein